MIEKLNRLFDELCCGLNNRGLNYTASIRLFTAPGMADRPLSETARQAIGNPCAVIDAGRVAGVEELLRELKNAVNFKGDGGAHPTPGYADSLQCVDLLRRISELLATVFGNCDSIFAVQFAEGHPFYPVFWDFAFLLERTPDAFLLVASSSD